MEHSATRQYIVGITVDSNEEIELPGGNDVEALLTEYLQRPETKLPEDSLIKIVVTVMEGYGV